PSISVVAASCELAASGSRRPLREPNAPNPKRTRNGPKISGTRTPTTKTRTQNRPMIRPKTDPATPRFAMIQILRRNGSTSSISTVVRPLNFSSMLSLTSLSTMRRGLRMSYSVCASHLLPRFSTTTTASP
ncbi:hypothetical protein PENTCL1PPCAC_21967, partial [Pristionchus entomophagus]